MSNIKKSDIKNPLFPISEPAKFVGENGEIMTPLYFTGEPRDYRLDLGFGELCAGGEREKVKGLGKVFKVIPIAVRCLEGKLFVKKEQMETTPIKKWFEVYFVNELGNLSMFMFHGFSVANLAVATKELKYQGAKLTEAVWEITCIAKTNRQTQSTYYMAYFKVTPLAEEDKATMKAVYQNVIGSYYHIYRHETRDYKTLYSENWSDGKTQTTKELADFETNQQALLGGLEAKQPVAETEQPKAATSSKKKEAKAA